ncbi:tRNA nucleotidyltransferase (CCA-adding enzyme) [Acetitomaculum ruminis DSM 5522]|uniref:tRNA nucleotidyltransferase (CCA-adding enzyme) n=1 Tax=Acetitomaculum ruminis DSM 5522 TaxID=1120918 RepID=A0A1I0W1T1_9FIRM|nr:CCA tRNA nucleotidyltransferase [Acetitomaculum ruminis]SFA82715.1 tRNA nucleotidyltransferase (CCA-adding enzyme) [Acetitomaculum ruminis DSM 5522]
MKVELPENVSFIIKEIKKRGYDAYAVGGCVRDTILNKKPGDWDITTSAKPEKIKEIFKRTIDTGLQHGTVTVMIGKEGYEVTTYRIDGSYSDGRHPDYVDFTTDLTEDLKRRDFTINAMAYNDESGIVDCFEGEKDLEKKIIRCVGNPDDRFKEDALRMLRAIRFAGVLGFEIDEATRLSIKNNAKSLSAVSPERIQVEFVKLLCSDHPEKIRQAYELGITKVFIPEFDIAMESEQNNINHMYSVGEHIIHVLMNVSKDKCLRLAALFHDIGKPAMKTTDENGIDHFKGHPQKGEEIAKKVMKRLKFDNATIKKVCRLVLWHDARPKATDRSVREFLYNTGEDIFEDLMKLKDADMLSQSTYKREEKLALIRDYRTIHKGIIERGECFSLKQLKISGNDLMECGLKQGALIGDTLKELLKMVIDDPSLNDRAILLDIVKNKK